jgi:hypothetical protein
LPNFPTEGLFLVSEGDDFFPDEEGLELSTIEAVQEEAA